MCITIRKQIVNAQNELMKLNEQQLELLEKWLEDPSFRNWADRSNERDIADWEHFFNVHPQHWELAKIARSLVEGVPFRSITIDKPAGQKALSKLLDRLEQPRPAVEKGTRVKHLKRYRFRWTAAAVLLLFSLCAGTYLTFFYNPKVLLSTPYGEQIETLLPDCSIVHLNANSQLIYYRRNPRKVWLEGEAFFQVKKQPLTNEQFQVITADLAVTVLGTAFNINARNDRTEVFLEEGKVSLEMAGDKQPPIEMEPGDVVAYSMKKGNLLENQQDFSAVEVVSWREGTLIFDKTPLSEALFEIEDIYGIQFVIQTEELLDETITGGVPIKDLEVTLETLRNVYGLQMKTAGKRYLISGSE